MLLSSARRVFGASLVALLAGGAAYTGILCSGHFLSSVPKHRGETAWFLFAGLWLLAAWRNRGGGGASRQQTAGIRWSDGLAISAAFLVLSGALYWPALNLGLLSDDFVLLARAARHDFWSASPFWRPIPLMLWAAAGDSGSAAVGLHAVNVVLHAANGVLLAAIARRIGLPNRVSLTAGVLFVCFPASVEAVAWASGIQDVLMATGCLIFVFACSSAEPRWGTACAGLAGLALALGTKETAVAAPFLAFALWWRRGERRRILVLAGAAAALAYAWFRMPSVQGNEGFAIVPSRYFVKELLSRPFATLSVPFTSAELARAPAIGVAMTWLVLAPLVAAVTFDRGTAARAGIVVRSAAWVLLAVAPVYSMFFVSADLQGSRYLYLPACGWAMLLSALLLDSSRAATARLGLLMTAALALVWAGGIRLHLADWESASRLRDRVLASADSQLSRTDCGMVHFTGIPDSVGGAYVFRNGFLEAIGAAATAGAGAAGSAGGPSATACAVEWRGGAFQQAAADSGGPSGTRWSAPSRSRR